MPDNTPNATSTKRNENALRALMHTIVEVLDDAIAGSERERHDTERRGLVGGVGEHARIAHVQIRHVMRLPEAIRHETLRIIPHATGAALVQAPARNEWRLA